MKDKGVGMLMLMVSVWIASATAAEGGSNNSTNVWQYTFIGNGRANGTFNFTDINIWHVVDLLTGYDIPLHQIVAPTSTSHVVVINPRRDDPYLDTVTLLITTPTRIANLTLASATLQIPSREPWDTQLIVTGPVYVLRSSSLIGFDAQFYFQGDLDTTDDATLSVRLTDSTKFGPYWQVGTQGKPSHLFGNIWMSYGRMGFDGTQVHVSPRTCRLLFTLLSFYADDESFPIDSRSIVIGPGRNISMESTSYGSPTRSSIVSNITIINDTCIINSIH
jgi:hypothetical protein